MNRARIVSIFAGVLLTTVAGCAGANTSSKMSGQDPYAQQSAGPAVTQDAHRDVKITSVGIVQDPYTGPELDTTYIITNPTAGKVSYTVRFEYLDKHGTRVAEGSRDTDSLSGHQSAVARMILWGDEYRQSAAVTVRVLDVTRVSVE